MSAGQRIILNDKLAEYCGTFSAEFDLIPPDRKDTLEDVANFIKSKCENRKVAELVFICTHNSRRSHFGQIWAKTAAAFFGINRVETYSGGTEATAFNPRVVEALKLAGFETEITSHGDNPVYRISFSGFAPGIPAWSKRYDSKDNPESDFCAIMTCSRADEECPFIPGASRRFSLPYEDPKLYDGTELEMQAYKDRCRQIGREMFYLFFTIK